MFPCVQWDQAWKAESCLVGFTIAIHVVDVGLHLSAVETVQETPRDLSHHGSVWDRLGHAVDGSLKRRFVRMTVSSALINQEFIENTDYDLLFSVQQLPHVSAKLTDHCKSDLLIRKADIKTVIYHN